MPEPVDAPLIPVAVPVAPLVEWPNPYSAPVTAKPVQIIVGSWWSWARGVTLGVVLGVIGTILVLA